jgi:hypothetical protein
MDLFMSKLLWRASGNDISEAVFTTTSHAQKPQNPKRDESVRGRDESGRSGDESATGWDESAARGAATPAP